MRPIFLALILSLVLVTPVFAEGTPSANLKQRIQDKQAAIKERIQTTKENLLSRKEDKKASISARKVERVEDRQARKEALKEKLTVFKDQKKAVVAERVSDNLSKVNENRTTAMLKHLEKLSEIALRLEDRLTKVETEGKDVTSAKAALETAKTAILNADAIVTAQAEKDYTLTVSSESKVKSDAQSVRTTLKEDLKVAHESVKAAKDALVDVVQSVKLLNEK